MPSSLVVSVIVLVFAFHVEKATALNCWKCSSDIDPSCSDPFNEANVYSSRRGQSGLYDNLQDNYQQRNLQDRNYQDRNYQDQYNQRQGQGYDPNRGYNPGFSNQAPSRENCDENEARLRRMRNVCIKKTIKGTNYVSVIRRCAMIGPEESVGTCYDPVSRGLSLEFCEYCDYDGCNSATGLKNKVLLSLVPVAIALYFLRGM